MGSHEVIIIVFRVNRRRIRVACLRIPLRTLVLNHMLTKALRATYVLQLQSNVSEVVSPYHDTVARKTIFRSCSKKLPIGDLLPEWMVRHNYIHMILECFEMSILRILVRS